MAPSSAAHAAGSYRRQRTKQYSRVSSKSVKKQPAEGDKSGMIMLLGTMLVVLVGALITIASFSV